MNLLQSERTCKTVGIFNYIFDQGLYLKIDIRILPFIFWRSSRLYDVTSESISESALLYSSFTILITSSKIYFWLVNCNLLASTIEILNKIQF